MDCDGLYINGFENRAMMDKEIIFEDDQIRVIFLKGSSDELVFSFGDLITRAKGTSINAEKSLHKYEFNVVGIMPKQKSWFPEQSMRNMLESIQDRIASFENRIAYGGSMGGYAAIKYANLLNFQRVVAMVPQYSIDPMDVEDKRYNMFYQPDLNAGMRVEAQDVSATREYILVYDPYYAEDRVHIECLKPLLPEAKHLHLPYTNHDAIAVLASSELVHDFIRHPFEASYFYQKMRRVKKNSKFYYRKVIENLLPRHRMALGRILKNNHLKLDSQFFDAKQKQEILRELFSNKQVDQQDLLKLGIEVVVPQEKRNILHDAFGHGLVFNVISQKVESYAPGAIALNHKFLIPLYAQGNSLAEIIWNNQAFIVVMNDRQVMKLIHADDALPAGTQPLMLRKHADFYAIGYKSLHLCTDEFGAAVFTEALENGGKFLPFPEGS